MFECMNVYRNGVHLCVYMWASILLFIYVYNQVCVHVSMLVCVGVYSNIMYLCLGIYLAKYSWSRPRGVFTYGIALRNATLFRHALFLEPSFHSLASVYHSQSLAPVIHVSSLHPLIPSQSHGPHSLPNLFPLFLISLPSTVLYLQLSLPPYPFTLFFHLSSCAFSSPFAKFFPL